MYFFPNIDERNGIEFIISEIVAYDEPIQHDGFTVYPSVTLEGGTTLKGVKVDNAINEHFVRSLNAPRVVYVVKKLINGWVVYAIESEGRLLTGVLSSFARRRYMAAGFIVVMAALIPLAGATGGEIGLTLLASAALMSLLSAVHFNQLGSMLRAASRLRNTRSLDIA